MSRTNISTEKQEIAVQREGTLTWIGALILEVIMCMVAYYIADLIGEGASFWHHKVGLFDYAGRAAKWFGFRKTWGNFALAVVYETLALRLFIKCLGVEFSTDSKDSASRAENIMAIGTIARLAVYIAIAFFKHSSSFYGSFYDKWSYKMIYSRTVAHDYRWILFWSLIGLVVAMIMYVFSLRRNNLTVVTCLLIIVGLVTVGAYFNTSDKTCHDAILDIRSFVEGTDI